MKLRAFILLLVLSLALPFAAAQPAMAQDRIEVAQEKRTLWDMLFGGEEKKQEEPAVRRSAPAASLPPPVPEVEKSEEATRVAVFGDSLAVDLAKALERTYAEDPNLVVINQGVGSSGFVRDDYFDWGAAIQNAVADDTFDIAVVIMGINDRQNLSVDGESVKPLTDEWKAAYAARVSSFLQPIRAAGKPVIWLGMPPMQAPSYSAAISQISSVQKLAAFSAGAEFVDIYERFTDENGNYTNNGPDINGQPAVMRKGDGIHFARAGADKLAFYVNQSLKLFYRGGGQVRFAIADPLEGTDALLMARLPLQGLGQIRLLEVAGAVIPLGRVQQRSGELLSAGPAAPLPAGFELDDLVTAPVGRADAFGVGVEPGTDSED